MPISTASVNIHIRLAQPVSKTTTTSCTHSGDLSVPLAVDMSLHVDGACGAAMRRRQRRLRAQLRHEQQTVAMVLATVGHHSFGPTAYDALRSQKPVTSTREGVEGETYDAPRRQKPPPPGTRPASLAEPRGDVMQVQRHTVEHLADGAPSLPTLDVPVPQMVDQPVDILKIIAMLLPAVDEQVIDVPKIIHDPTPQRLRPPEPQQLVEQLVEVPVPPVREVTIMAPFVDPAGRTWYWLSGTDGGSAWYAGWYTPRPVDPPGGAHRQPRAVYKYWARMMIFLPCTWQSLFGVGLA